MSEEFKQGGFVPRPLSVANYIPLSPEFERDLAVARKVRELVNRVIDRRMNPWRYADPNPMPEIVLFPRVAKVERWLTRN